MLYDDVFSRRWIMRHEIDSSHEPFGQARCSRRKTDVRKFLVDLHTRLDPWIGRQVRTAAKTIGSTWQTKRPDQRASTTSTNKKTREAAPYIYLLPNDLSSLSLKPPSSSLAFDVSSSKIHDSRLYHRISLRPCRRGAFACSYLVRHPHSDFRLKFSII
jgi:hypothetical protein